MEPSKKENTSSIFYNIFLDFVDFSERNFIFSKLSEIINSGMSLIKRFPFLNGSALYLMNNETFELDLKYEYSIDNSNNHIKEIFEQLIEEGVVGEVLQNCKMAHYNLADQKSILIVFPLISIDGVLGVIILNTETVINNIQINMMNLVKLISSSLANMISTHNLKESNKRNEDLIDQAIAVRTRKLIEDQQVLGERLEKMKSNLSMALPHEFRTPINQIFGFSNYLVQHFKSQEGEDFEDIIEIVNDIKESANRLKFSFENYLYFANLFIISANIEDIRKLQKNVTYYVDTVIFEYIMTVAYKYDRSHDAEVFALESTLQIGEEHLIKIIQEIADNCFKYSEPGTKVKISTNIEKNYYNIIFVDHGIGLKTNDIGHIDAYMQFERTHNEQQGLGLGLSIVRKILDIYHGDIELDSEPMKYTKVIISIPISENAD
jgi:K+-sensing histidine kinase KdpD